MTLWLVRHAQPLVEPGICYGHLDLAADAQATQSCAQALAKVLPKSVPVVASPLQRCEQLVLELIGLRPDLTFKTEPKLQEMHFGEWEGRAWAEVPRAELDAWTASFSNYAVGSTGESVTQFMARVASVFDALPTTSDTLWITHAGVIQLAQLLARGVRRVDRADQWPRLPLAYGQWCKLSL